MTDETTGDEVVMDVKCYEERCVIGVIRVPSGGMVRLTAAEVMRRFEPSEQRFRLQPNLRDGDLFRCPRCQRPVSVVGLMGKDEVTASVVFGALTVKG